MESIQLALDGKLWQALQALAPLVEAEYIPWNIRREYADICDTCRMMLDYFAHGVRDPERDHIYATLTQRTLRLCDQVQLAEGRVHPLPGSGVRYPATPGFGDASYWSSADFDDARQQLADIHASTSDLCLLVSNVTLSLMQLFDERKMLFLCYAVGHPSDEVLVRAVTALAITVRLHKQRIIRCPELHERISRLAEDTLILNILTDVELAFVRSRDSEAISQHIQDDIVPGMLRHRPKHPGTGTNPFLDGDPDWDKWLQESGLEETLSTFSQLQQEGADIYLATFANLKSNPFFNERANWFRPFDPDHPAVRAFFGKSNENGNGNDNGNDNDNGNGNGNSGTVYGSAPNATDESAEAKKPETDNAQEPPRNAQPTQPKGNLIKDFLIHSPFFCNSDKYSFCFAVQSLTGSQFDVLRFNLDDIDAELGEQITGQLRSSRRDLTRQYIQDLYRFFHLHVDRRHYPDPFTFCGYPGGTHALPFFTLPPASLIALAELDCRRHDWATALDDFDRLLDSHPEAMNATLWQKLGYCRQHSGDPSGALDALLMADILQPDHAWTLLHIAQCHRALAHYDEALEAFQRLAVLQPDVTSHAYRQARCLIHLNRCDEALPLLHRVLYHEPDDHRAICSVIECHLRLGQPQNALKHVQHLLDDPSADLDDQALTLIGTTHWLLGDSDAALHAFTALDADPDTSLLQELGIPTDDLPYLRDLILSKKED